MVPVHIPIVWETKIWEQYVPRERIKYNEFKMSFFPWISPDYSSVLQQFNRKCMTEIHLKLLKMDYELLYPARFKVSYFNQTYIFVKEGNPLLFAKYQGICNSKWAFHSSVFSWYLIITLGLHFCSMREVDYPDL